MIEFNELVESIKKLDYDELLEVNSLTKNYIEESNRNRLLQDHLESKEELENGNINFSSDINFLTQEIELI
jgi:hypothetical protein